MVKRHKGRSARPTTVDSTADIPPVIREEIVPAEAAIGLPADTAEDSAISTREALLESVSPDALQADPAATNPVAIDLDEPPATEVPGPQPASDVDAPVPVFQPASPKLSASPVPTLPMRGSALDAMSELTEVNATLVAFLQGEGQATISHFRALAAAKTPADAIRLQVGEMQRAADASLTCFSVLARRATRLAEAFRPR
ncbi:hypothetical protein OCOJLMKI_4017 [Methylobacterium iners]|uniref:Phasin domain-containing protein n=2 Tax=Methylobacterium iners TaxID=418707 RepID=A0ABQ4S4V6_9HYPH|nr:hypothetical protein OCOJLMKI_4017 [Methylobacterium iners]